MGNIIISIMFLGQRVKSPEIGWTTMMSAACRVWCIYSVVIFGALRITDKNIAAAIWLIVEPNQLRQQTPQQHTKKYRETRSACVLSEHALVDEYFFCVCNEATTYKKPQGYCFRNIIHYALNHISSTSRAWAYL